MVLKAANTLTYPVYIVDLSISKVFLRFSIDYVYSIAGFWLALVSDFAENSRDGNTAENRDENTKRLSFKIQTPFTEL